MPAGVTTSAEAEAGDMAHDDFFRAETVCQSDFQQSQSIENDNRDDNGDHGADNHCSRLSRATSTTVCPSRMSLTSSRLSTMCWMRAAQG